RLVDGRRWHWGGHSVSAETDGTHEILCRDRGDRTYPLVLARPAVVGPYRAWPGFGLFLVLIAGVVVLATSATPRSREEQ
ncbi:MAG: hypothetical protein M3217_01035, partial [Actinomycetota bacterium]|nr:hypothetical protein [Actinomycetota bacterium]